MPSVENTIGDDQVSASSVQGTVKAIHEHGEAIRETAERLAAAKAWSDEIRSPEYQFNIPAAAEAEIPLPGLPKTVNVCGRTYTVGTAPKSLPDGWDGSDDDSDGRSNHHKLSIWIYEGLSRRMQQETLLHEVLHCIMSFTVPEIRNVINGRDKLDILAFDFDEWYTEIMDAPLLTVLRENPELVNYLLN